MSCFACGSSLFLHRRPEFLKLGGLFAGVRKCGVCLHVSVPSRRRLATLVVLALSRPEYQQPSRLPGGLVTFILAVLLSILAMTSGVSRFRSTSEQYFVGTADTLQGVHVGLIVLVGLALVVGYAIRLRRPPSRPSR